MARKELIDKDMQNVFCFFLNRDVFGSAFAFRMVKVTKLISNKILCGEDFNLNDESL